MKKTLLVFSLIIILSTVATAGSVFSGGGIGLISNKTSGRFAGMGILGLAVIDSSTIGGINPAGWGGINLTRISVGAGIYHYASRDNSGSDVSDEFYIDYVALGISLRKNFTLGFKFSPYSRIDYRTFDYNSAGEYSYEDYNIGKGGVSVGTVVAAGKIYQDLYAGVGIDFIFGTLNTLWGANFTNSTISDVQYTLSNRFFGARPTLGLNYAISPKMNIGVYSVLSAKIPVEQELDYTYADSSSETDHDFNLPASFGIGVSYRTFPRMITSADFQYTAWKGDDQPVGMSERYQESLFLGAGMEIVPLSGQLLPIFQRIAYRAGFAYQNLYYQSPAGETVKDISFSAGLGFPLKDENSTLDTILRIGKRGDLTANNADELYITLGLYINTGEKWFERIKKY